MLRRCFSSLQLGAELFPTAHTALAQVDPWCLPRPEWKGRNTSHPRAPAPPAAQLATTLVNRDYRAAWYLFTHSKFPFNSEMLSKLLAVLPSGVETAHTWWPRALQIKQALDNRGMHLAASDYAVLINLASKAGRSAAVNTLWVEMGERRVARDTNVWNQYIMAVCDANPQFWPWPRSRSLSHARRVSQSATDSSSYQADVSTVPGALDCASSGHTIDSPERLNRVVTLLERMELEGVARNSRTYELTALALARHHNLEAAAQLINGVWGNGNGRPRAEPGLSTLTAIIDSFAFHLRLEEGYALATQIGGGLLGIHAANEFWTRLFRLAVVQTEPRANVRTAFNDEAWQEMTKKYKFGPKLGLWSIRMEYLEMKNRFSDMFREIPRMLEVAGGLALAESVATRAAVGLGNTGQALDALRSLQTVHRLGVDPTRDLVAFLAERGATAEQLQMFDEDDDEDGLTGSHIL